MKKFAIPFIFLLIVLAIGRYYYHLEAEKKLQHIIQNIAPWVLIRYEDLDVSLDGKITLQKVTAFTQQQKGIFQAESFEIIDFKILNNRPVHLDIRATSLKFNVLPNLKPGTYGLYNLGYKKLMADIELSYKYNDFSNRFMFNMSLNLDNLGKSKLNLNLANVDIEQWQYYLKDPNSILLIDGSLKYDDASFITKLLDYAKKNKGLNDQEFSEYFKQRIIQIKKSNPLFEKDEKGYLKMWETFILNPQNFSLKVKSEEGLSVRQLKQLARKPDLFKKLDVLIKVNQ